MFNSEPRKLWFPLNRASGIVADTQGEGNTSLFSWPTTDNDERVTITLELSLNEYVALASCIDVGSDIAYSEDWLTIWLIWIRANTMAFCDNVADCIDTNETTQLAINNQIENNTIIQQTINNFLLNDGLVNPNTIDPDNTTGTERIPDADTAPINPPPAGCDLDALWAGIRSMVDRLDQNGRDILEDLATINDKVEQIAEIIDLVPLLGDTIKDISDLFTETVPDLLNAYNAASSPTFLDNVACALFEMVCQECRYPTYDEVFGYLVNNSALALPSTLLAVTYGAVWDLVKAVSVLTPEIVWYSLNVWQCVTLAFDGYFNRSYGKKTFQIWCSFGEDNPNDNWTILCDGCDTWCKQLDLTAFSNFDWSPGGSPQYLGTLSGNEWIATTVTGIGTGKVTGIGVEPAIFSASNITRVVVDYDAIEGLGNGTKYPVRIIIKNGTATVWDSIVQEPAGSWGVGQQVDWSFDLTATEVRFYQAVDDTTGTPTGSGKLTGLRLYGNGVNPFGAGNC